jgi:lipid II:glycine glycyltransferase (peptidoglycan interpeptide bridge formation enzyme)
VKLVEVLNEDKNIYNRFVMDHENGSFLQSWEWGEWQKKLGRNVVRYYIQDISGQKIGAFQLIKMPLPFKKFYWYAPYGPVLTEGEQLWVTGDGSRVLLNLLKEKFSDAIFIRIEPKDLNFTTRHPLPATKSTNIQPAITMLSDIQKTPEELLAGMHQKTRYNIRLAEKHGVKVSCEPVVTPGFGLYLKEVVDLLLETQKRQKYNGHSAAYYKNFINFFAGLGKDVDVKINIYRATFQRDLLATGVMVDFGNTRIYLFGGSSDAHKNLMAPYLMHYQAMIDTKNLGLSFYDWGGSEVSAGGEKGFTRFKQGFGGQIINYAGAYDVINNKAQYSLYKMMRSVNKYAKKVTSSQKFFCVRLYKA